MKLLNMKPYKPTCETFENPCEALTETLKPPYKEKIVARSKTFDLPLRLGQGAEINLHELASHVPPLVFWGSGFRV